MQITSLSFALFFSITLILYFAIPKKQHQWIILLIASCFFYAYNSYRYAVFILITIITTYLAANRMHALTMETKAAVREHKAEWSKDEKKAFKEAAGKRRRRLLIATLLLNFGILFMLKYFNFFSGSIASMLGGSADDAPQIHLLLPLGISFYTFIATGYLIDVYRETAEPESNIFRFALFVSFFPHIIQGPISSSEHLRGQLFEPHSPEWKRFKLGGWLILWGMFKKLVIADTLYGPINTVCRDYASYGGEVILMAALMYALQLYADFSGGIDIVRGVAKILGIDLEINFRQPYFSRSISEYWRRWHITLGAWMKKYVFYSLAVSKSFLDMGRKLGSSAFGKTAAGNHIARTLPTALSSFVVFMLIGIWHGANSRYIGFGLWNGLVIMMSAFLAPVYEIMLEKLRIRSESLLWRLFQMARTFLIVLIGYYFDIAPDFSGALEMMRRSVADFHMQFSIEMIRDLGLCRSDCLAVVYASAVLLYFSIRLEQTGLEAPGDLVSRRPAWLQWAVILIAVLSVITFGLYGSGAPGPDFVYMGF